MSDSAAPTNWQPEVDELNHRRTLAKKLGGKERVDKQHALGKLTVRERIDALVDPGSFHEIGGLAGYGSYDNGTFLDFTPLPYIGGLATVGGRRVVVGGNDFTVGGGAADISTQERFKNLFLADMAREYRVPLMLFHEGAGANVAAEGDGHGHLPSSFDVFGPDIRAGQEVPVVYAVSGATAGGVAAHAMLGHFVVMTPQGALFAGGPPLVKRALGADVTKDELGGPDVHVMASGAIDNRASDELDAIAQMQKFLSYFPQNVYQQPPVLPSNDPADREEEELLSIVPRARTRAYNMRRVVELIVDDGDYFEVQPEFATSVHTILARVGGYTVGIVANNPKMLAGAMTATSADKQGHFVELCDHFHIPIVFLADVPGFMLGVQAERTGTLRHGMRAYWATYLVKVPVFTVITRKNFGMAGQATANVGSINYRVGWPSGDWGSIPIEGGVAAAYKREIEAAPDPDARRKEIEDHLLQFRNPFRTAEAFGIEDIIDPRQTRSYVHRFLELAYETLSTQLGMVSKVGVRP
ncbi:MAG: Acetyl-CoA carboxylase, carboxyltransferase component [Chloroflexi bacterium]|nr:MAG: Acetyl-CoA carboxylase, carboxyltransferase component [Chloroflexota bacterium]